ncbi:ABC transporter substrate-binding protein [Variovorax sp. J31P207]|uniref:ABC transporter substrate-binding protein n=1 Tax=Variovorax sp. J31P207 TaxID=3053510 RepID=UPI002576D8C0|nr:ABC transporter substrate-binding protein [Variovorax sp. J31P207]MDM0072661.1 ABC transporter substrate-binding protein [Variovorax sp. J31P207]
MEFGISAILYETTFGDLPMSALSTHVPVCLANRRSRSRLGCTTVALVSALWAQGSQAQAAPGTDTGISDGVVRIGLLLDMSGPYADISGRGTVTAVQMAIDDFGGTVGGKKIDLVVADTQLKADIASSKAREWFDVQKVDTIQDVTGSAPSLAVLEVAREKKKVIVFNGPATERFTMDLCSPVSVHYSYDSYALANSLVRSLMAAGQKNWFFVTVDNAGGYALEQGAASALEGASGKVAGKVRHPLNAPDMSSYVLQAKSSNADVMLLANAGSDTINTIKTAREFGVGTSGSKQTVAAALLFINDIHAIGLNVAQGMQLAESFYWDATPETRAWSKRYFEKMKRMPNMGQAGSYSSTMHYLKAVKAAGTDETAAVMRKMKETPINDFFAQNGRIREDGLMVHDMYLYKVKAPKDSKYPWDYYTPVATVPGAQAFRSLDQSTCPLVKRS